MNIVKYIIRRIYFDGKPSIYVDTASSIEQAANLARLDRANLRDNNKIHVLSHHTVTSSNGNIYTINVPR